MFLCLLLQFLGNIEGFVFHRIIIASLLQNYHLPSKPAANRVPGPCRDKEEAPLLLLHEAATCQSSARR